jgi:NAD(P)-dependent dehydrogenase (short-subunit alcohol dehydrogenase family)
MDTDLGPTVVAGSDARVVDDLVRAAASTTPVISVSPGQPATSRAAVVVPGHPDGWIRAAAEVEHTWGLPRTVIVSPAPVARSGLADLAGAGWQAALDRNLGVATEVCRAFAPGLATRSPASIVIVTWQHARGPGTAHLAAVAGAVRLFALSLAADLGASGITVNAVAVAEDDVAAAWPAVRLLSSPDAGYLTAEVFTARRTAGAQR